MNKVKLTKEAFEKITDEMPADIFEVFKRQVESDESMLDPDGQAYITLNSISCTDTIMPISDAQFRELFTIFVDKYMKPKTEGISRDQVGEYTVHDFFNAANLFLRLNRGKLVTEDNILFILNIWKELYYDYSFGNDLNSGYWYIELPTSNDISYGSGFQYIFELDTFRPTMSYEEFFTPRIVQFIKDNLEIFTIRYRIERAFKTYLVPELQKYLPFDVDFVKEHSDLFLAPVFALNPLAKSVAYQTVLFGPMTEDFVNTLYDQISPALNKHIKLDTDDIMACIFRAV